MPNEKYGVIKTGICRICGRDDKSTEMHHIISQNQIRKASKIDLQWLMPGIIRAGINLIKENPSEEEVRKYAINNLPGNIVELCGGCHDLTRSSHVWRKNKTEKEDKKFRKEIRNLYKKREKR